MAFAAKMSAHIGHMDVTENAFPLLELRAGLKLAPSKTSPGGRLRQRLFQMLSHLSNNVKAGSVALLIACFAGETGTVGLPAQAFVSAESLGEPFKRTPFERFPEGKCVSQFRFNPDGTEVWCLAGSPIVRRGDSRGRALVFNQTAETWSFLPAVANPAVFHDVAFSGDGKTTWIAMSSDEDRGLRVRQRNAETEEWQNPDRMPPDYTVVERFWLSPNGRELWMDASGCGLIRQELASDRQIQYVQSDFRQFDNTPHGALIEDYVQDLVFTADSKHAVCAAAGGGNQGITSIDLVTNEAKNFPVVDASHFEQLVMAPNDQHVWCIGNNSYLWCFDVKAETWAHQCSSHDGMPMDRMDGLVCSRDSRRIWISGDEGIASYSLDTKQWTRFTGQDWFCDSAIPEELVAPLMKTRDGR